MERVLARSCCCCGPLSNLELRVQNTARVDPTLLRFYVRAPAAHMCAAKHPQNLHTGQHGCHLPGCGHRTHLEKPCVRETQPCSGHPRLGARLLREGGCAPRELPRRRRGHNKVSSSPRSCRHLRYSHHSDGCRLAPDGIAPLVEALAAHLETRFRMRPSLSATPPRGGRQGR